MATRRIKTLSVTTRIVACALALALGFGILGLLVMTRPTPPVVDAPASARRVEVMEAVAVPVRRQWLGFGTAEAIDSADVPAEIAGVVAEVPRTSVAGAAVARGDLIAALDDDDRRQELEIARRQLVDAEAAIAQLAVEEASWRERLTIATEETELASAELERAREAQRRDVARQREVDQVRMTYDAILRAQTQLREELDKVAPRRTQLHARKAVLAAQEKIAQKNLDRCRIVSPLDGVLQLVDVETGEAVSPGLRVARVVNLSRIEVPLALPASARPQLGVGDAVTLRSRGVATGTWEAAVRRIGPEDDQSTRTMTVYVELDQDPAGPEVLAPGRFVEAEVTSRRAEMRFVVPRRSILDDRILLVADDRVQSRPVRVAYHVQGQFPDLGVLADQWAVLAEPLPERSRVVVNASRSLTDGLAVEPVVARSSMAAGNPERPVSRRGSNPRRRKHSDDAAESASER